MEDELNGIKQKIKQWEHGFKSREGRVPNKEDIDNSGIQEDYLRYNELKQQKQSCNNDIDNRNAIPEWKKLGIKGLSLERSRKYSSKNLVVKDFDLCSEEIVNNISNSDKALDTNETPKFVETPPPLISSLIPAVEETIQEDTQCGTRLPTHYDLVKKQQSRHLYTRAISSEWLERHDAELSEDICNPNPCNSSCYNRNRNVIKEPIESALFTKLYQADTPQQEDTPVLSLGAGELTITHKPADTTAVIAEESLTEAGEDLIGFLEASQESVDKDETIPFKNLEVTQLINSPPKPTSTIDIPEQIRTQTNAGESEVNTGQKRAMKSAVSNSKRPKLNNSLSDNFVRLDLRRKHYKAKGRGFSSKTYKRNMFKKKQFDNDRGGVPQKGVGGLGGGTRCFKCGEVGHWARNCTQSVAESDLGKFAGETCSFRDTGVEDEQEIFESPLPTLEEAKLMSQGKSLTEIRNAEGKENNFDIPMGGMVAMNTTVIRQDIEPYFPADTSQCEIDKRLEAALQTLKHSSFRDGQREAVTRILQGRSTLVLLGTGGGKSLCYQLPALLYSQRQTCSILVISPLVSLMEDQCLHMPTAITATCLHTNQTPKQREKILLAMKESKFSVILLSPEMVASQEKSVSEVFSLLPPIPFVCIDEVHCLSQWSHNFRPSYLRLCKVIKERFGVSCILALTATATRNTVNDLKTRLSISGEEGVIKGPILPNNLKLSVSRAKDRDQSLVDMFNSAKYTAITSIIVYCIRQKETERIAQLIRTCVVDTVSSRGQPKSSLSKVAECYHAGMTGSRRNQVQKAFMSGKLKIVVATLAFGMGLNKSDVRAIIHYNMPSSCENYVQEVGRAGRDGVTSYCHVFLEEEDTDLCELRKHAYANGMDTQSLMGFVNAVFPTCKCEFSRGGVVGCPGHTVGLSIDRSVTDFDLLEGSLGTMLCYCEGKGWIDLTRQQYDTCHIKCYGRERQLRKLAEKMPVIAAGIALHNSSEAVSKGWVSVRMSEVSRRMGWEYATLKRELGSLSYNDRGTGGKQNSSVIVEMTDLAYMLQMYHREDNSVEEVVTFLETKIHETELLSLNKLSIFSGILTGAASGRDETLFRERLRKYFEDETDTTAPPNLTDTSMIPRLRQEVSSFISTHFDSKLTGRAVARIFQGISSPNYPAHMWGSTQYWRSYMNADFHLIRKMAEKELERY